MHQARRLACLALIGLALGADPVVADDGWKVAKKEFKAAQKADDWKIRRDAYVDLAYHDGAEVVSEINSALGKERNPAVILKAIETLAAFQTQEAKDAIAKGIRKGKGARRLYFLMALEKQKG